MMKLKPYEFALLALLLVYVLIRVAWWGTYPAARNYDHFNTETALNLLENPALYPTDPIWQAGGQTKSLGFVFLGFWQIMEAIFGEFLAAWNFVYALHLVIFLAGTVLFFQKHFQNSWLAVILAIVASMPFYFYFSYTSWGISSPYARQFTTIQAPWLFLALFILLEKRPRQIGYWLAFGAWVGSINFWNPVNGLALVQIFAFVLLLECLNRRIVWREFLAVAGMSGGIFAFYYFTAGSTLTATAEQVPLTEAELQAIVDGWVNFAGLHFFPWTVTQSQALMVLGAILTGTSLLFLVPFRPKWAWWLGLVALACQLPAPMLISKDSTFILILGYWLYRYQKTDRWDWLLLASLCAVNLASLVQSALGFYFFTELKSLTFASVAFESYRPLRWAFWLLFIFAGRLGADWVKKGDLPSLLALAMMLGALVSRMGHVGLDDGMIVRPVEQEDLRHAMPFIALIFAFMGQIPTRQWKPILNILAVGGSAFVGYEFVRHLPDWYTPIFATYAVFLLLSGIFALWALSQEKRLQWVIFGGFALLLWVLPMSAYYRAKPNFNPSADFEAAADWAKMNTPNEALFLPVGLDPMPFRADSERSVLAWDLLQIYYFLGPRAYLESGDLLEKLISLDPQNPEAYRETVDSLEVDFVVGDNRLPYPTVFYSETVSVYYPVRKSTRDSFYDLPTRGMSEAVYQAFLDFERDLVPEDETLFMPVSHIRRTEGLQALALMTQSQSDLQPFFELMVLLEKMRHQHELDLAESAESALNQWNGTKQADDLAAAGIHYLLVDDRWWNALGEDQRAQLQDPAQYELLQEWTGLSTAFYRLYRVQK